MFDKVGGYIVGAAGLLLGIGQLRGMKGICLMGETHGNYVDPKAAKNVLRILMKDLGIEVKLDELESKAKEIGEMISKLEQVQKSQQQPLPSPEATRDQTASYIR